MTTIIDTDPLVGRVLDGRYQIVRRRARGGMATVYVATDQRLARTVAVKVMHESLGGDADFVSRFDREARAAACLSHPNIVAVFDQGIDNGRPYIVMEYVEGQTLRQLMVGAGAMPAGRVLDLILPIASAVAAAHETGIVHRDLKPENVLIGERGQIKVADFGLARAVTAQTSTGTGTLIGTVSYIAPELVTNGKGDQRGDVYALGIVLYEMLTGRKPHTGETPIQVAYSHVHSAIEPPSKVLPAQAPRIPDYIDALVLAAAAREPKNRPQDGSVLLAHLRAARESLAKGKGNDPLLAAQLRRTAIDSADTPTEQVPTTGASEPTAVLAASPIPVASGTTARIDTPDFVTGTPYRQATPSMPEHSSRTSAVRAAAGLQARRKKRRKRGLAAFLIVILATALVGVSAWYYLEGRFVDVPEFASLTQARAEALADNTGIDVTFTNDYSEDVTAGQIIRTDPPVGTPVLRGGEVAAVLSLGPERYEVPDVLGDTLEKATKALTDAHLAVGTTNQVYHDKAKSGTIVKMSIKAGEMVKPDTKVNLDVSKGPQPVAIVDYTGKPLTEAEEFFKSAGLKVKVSKEVNSTSVRKGSIISQDPTDGELPRGSTVSVTVSKGPKMIEVPNIRGMSTSAARKKLENAGFKVKINILLGRSIAVGTDPGEGKKAAEGSTVNLHVA